MKNALRLSCLVLLLCGVLAAQSKVPTCNGFDPNGVPIDTVTNSTNCTDFFGVGNWANSPLPAGSITGFTIVSAGSGYVNPVVVITDPTGTGATAAATLATDGTGAIASISGTGTNYTMPLVSVVDVGLGGAIGAATCGGVGQPVCGSGAMATAIIGPPYSGGMLKFQDALPDLKGAIAIPDTATFPGSDFYIIGLVQYQAQMHANLPSTTLRGYCQLANTTTTTCSGQSYLGPVILAQKDRPVRVLFRNLLPAGAGGNLFIPVDTTYMGSGPNDPQNRATLHLHGGATPWISDGTPHQWTTPEGDTPMNGSSTQPVPDMYFSAGNIVPFCTAAVTSNCFTPGNPSTLPSGATNTPPPGDMTFFWTNQQGGRLMFYHDHAYGITRLNVYAGEAAGYLLYDPAEETALANASAPGSITAGDLTHLIPLVIQDKTFVPSKAQLDMQDPTWDGNFGASPLSTTASNGDLWFPHVYIPNQNPADPLGGGNPFGRWDYGPWFFPPMTTLTAANPTTAVTIPCTSAGFPGEVLTPSAANNNQVGCPIIPNPSGTPEAFMDTPVVNGKAYPVLHVAPAAYRFQILSAGNDRSLNLSWFLADPTQNNTEVAMLPAVPPGTGTAMPLCTAINPVAVPGLVIGLATGKLDGAGNPLNGTGLPSGCWPNYGPQPGIPAPQTMWAADGRAGGAPDPRNAGPAWVEIGSEGGLLPAPVVIPPTPINYEQNTRSITIGSVAVHGLWLGPAERADVIVDFSQYAGKTLILYNDAPTPAPAFDSRLDYFTGDGDQTPIGGAPNTPPGYGPNTRTIMQVIVDGNAPNQVPFSLKTLSAAFASTATSAGLFASTQPTTIVPEPNYNSAYNGNFPPVYGPISANTLTFKPLAPLTFEALLSAENLPNCTATPPAQCAPLNHKTIQELFTLDYGRMNATLGTELPNVNFQNQTTIPLGYVDPATEIVRQGDTQLWKITHNGVDSHFIHFHLFNVQVINRVGWDGSLRPPDANEMGWKDTVRMNPLEDIIVALQPITPQLPWPIPNSVRLNDVTGMATFTNLNPFSNGGAVTVDGPTNFGWEYVWHCHILGHEENDMMRPIVWQVPPPAPGNLTAAFDKAIAGQIDLSFTDNSANETGFILQRDTTSAFSAPFTITVPPIGTLNAAGEGVSWGQTISVTDNPGGGGPYFYRVQAVDDGFTTPKNEQSYNPTSALYSGWSNIVTAALTVPTTTFTGAPASAVYGSTFTVTASTNAPTTAVISGTGPCAVTMLANPTPASTQASVLMTSGTGTCVLTATWPVTVTFANATMQQTTAATKATPTTTFSGAPASAPYNSSFVVTATTNANTIPTITGTAGICSVGAISGTAVSAKATVTMISGTGSCVLTASWQADLNYTSALTTQTTTATKLNSVTSVIAHTPNPSVAGQGVVVTYTVVSATALSGGAAGPSGNVSVTANGSSCVGTVAAGTCTVTIPNAGSYTVTASYAGDTNFNTSSGTNGTSQQVRDFTMSISPSSQSINGNQQAKYTVTLRSQNGFTGAVAVSCGGTYPSSYSCSMSPTSANVPAGGSVTTTLTVNTIKGSPGTYTATVTGKYGTGTPSSGGLTHTVSATVTTKN